MLNINSFESVFGFNPDHVYSQTTYNDIHNHRRILHNKLYFDRLLENLQVKASHIYPPKTNNDLRELHRKIVTSQIAEHHKQSLLYYILLDCKASREIEPSEDFSTRCHLPEKYSLCLQGLWNMDRLQFQAALEALTQPSLPPTFPSEVLATLLEHHNSSDLVDLPIAFYNTVAPPLTPDSLLESYFRHLTSSNITLAFDFLHRQPAHFHHRLLELLIDSTLDTKHGNLERGDRATQLIDLPMNKEEEGVLEAYLLEGKGRTIAGASEVVAMRRIATGRVGNAIAKDIGLSTKRVEGTNWDTLRDGLGKGLGPRKDGVNFSMP